MWQGDEPTRLIVLIDSLLLTYPLTIARFAHKRATIALEAPPPIGKPNIALTSSSRLQSVLRLQHLPQIDY